MFEPPQDLHEALHWAAEFLPAQGPLTCFVHHNTLHAFQSLSFEEAVLDASKLYHCRPYMEESWYRKELARGRITLDDLKWALNRTNLGPASPELALSLLRYQLIQPNPDRLAWHLSETGALWRFRPELDPEVRTRLESKTVEWLGDQMRQGVAPTDLIIPFPDEGRGRDITDSLKNEPQALAPRALWTACLKAVENQRRTVLPRIPRMREQMMGTRVDELVHPMLIRWCGAYLDQGVSGQSMPNRELGFYEAIRQLYQVSGWLAPVWLQELAGLLKAEQAAGWSALDSIKNSLSQLGVSTPDQAEFLRDTALALKGWAGMMVQCEQRPDRLPFAQVPARFTDFCAVRLLLDRLALTHCQAQPGPKAQATKPSLVEGEALAFELYQICQFLGFGPGQVGQWSSEEIQHWQAQIEAFPALLRRQVLHHAYEHNYEVKTLDALSGHQPYQDGGKRPRFQAVLCIDEREESTRRHLEEIEPECETVGTAGFFGVAMNYKALHEPHAVPLCPVVITPTHTVKEVAVVETEERRLKSMRRAVGTVSLQLQTGSHTLTFGSLLNAGLGLLTSLPGILRVLFPRNAGLFARRMKKRLLPPKTRLEISYTTAEMATIVGNLLRETGMAARLSTLVVIIGHGSSSLNNPHEAAHDCGACGGGRGGPNARVFAHMANHPEVRQILAEQGLHIPDDTIFVGAYHNTCDDDVEYYDVEQVTPEMEYARLCLTKARARDARERCRRFESASPRISARSALAHVEARSEDLAQPRPEYGHATNAVCIVGRRTRTRGLYMDRRAFLTSYDPTQDDAEGTLLGRVLSAVVPVGAGINLEYYFSFTDNTGYGCGTKLPHNISGLLGVMDGHSSDLRTGLPWQMVEIHEPVRLLAVVETKLETLDKIIKRLPQLLPWVANGWIKLALLDPDSQAILMFDRGEWVPYKEATPGIPRVPESHDWYRAHREHLGYAEVG